jgi:hypothetical protein
MATSTLYVLSQITQRAKMEAKNREQQREAQRVLEQMQKLSDIDIEVRGARKCQFPSCNSVDFLPTLCAGCHDFMCRAHWEYKNHSCPAPPIDRRVSDEDVARSKKDAKMKCSLKGCKKKDYHSNLCGGCGEHHCFTHRFHSDHKCSNPPGRKKRAACTKSRLVAQSKPAAGRATARVAGGGSAVQVAAAPPTAPPRIVLSMPASLPAAAAQEQEHQVASTPPPPPPPPPPPQARVAPAAPALPALQPAEMQVSVDWLAGMGFAREQAVIALQIVDGDVQQAIDLLVSQQSATEAHYPSAVSVST